VADFASTLSSIYLEAGAASSLGQDAKGVCALPKSTAAMEQSVPHVDQLTRRERKEYDLRVKVGEDAEYVLRDIMIRRHVGGQLH
jgi:hypothetical protein